MEQLFANGTRHMGRLLRTLCAMPRKPRQIKQIRRFRTEVLKLTQTQFAHMIGVSASMVQAIELGTRPMTEEFAARVSYATGVKPECLLQESPQLLTVMGTPFLLSEDAKRNQEKAAAFDEEHLSSRFPTKTDYAALGRRGVLTFQATATSWARLGGVDEMSVGTYSDQLGKSVELLLTAACRASPSKTYAIGHAITRMLHQIALDFDVIKHLKALLAEMEAVPHGAPFIHEPVMDQDPSMEWLFYDGSKPDLLGKVAPGYEEASAQFETKKRDRFKWYGERMANTPPK